MVENRPTWQATVVGLAFLALIGAIFLSVFWKDGIDSALKAWAAIGTLVAVVVGAIPSYFFGAREAATAKDAARTATKQLEVATAARQQAEEQSRLVLANANPELIKQLASDYPRVFNVS